MKVLLDIQDNKAKFVMELLGSLAFVKAKTLTPSRALFLEELKEAAHETALSKKGKLKLRSAKDFVNDL